MRSCDTNILFPALNEDHAQHTAARSWLDDQSGHGGFVISEFTLVEVYMLLRNPVLARRPLTPAEAVDVIESLRSHAGWRTVDYPGGLMAEVWRRAAAPGVGIRQIIDTRLAVTLRHYGVTEFATANEKHFQGFGFERVWNPLREPTPSES